MLLELSDINQYMLIHRMSFLDLSHPFNVLCGCVNLSAVLMLLQHHVIEIFDLVGGHLRCHMLYVRPFVFLLIRRWVIKVLARALDCFFIVLHEPPGLHAFEF
jgi:hypothetical protein